MVYHPVACRTVGAFNGDFFRFIFFRDALFKADFQQTVGQFRPVHVGAAVDAELKGETVAAADIQLRFVIAGYADGNGVLIVAFFNDVVRRGVDYRITSNLSFRIGVKREFSRALHKKTAALSRSAAIWVAIVTRISALSVMIEFFKTVRFR